MNRCIIYKESYKKRVCEEAKHATVYQRLLKYSEFVIRHESPAVNDTSQEICNVMYNVSPNFLRLSSDNGFHYFVGDVISSIC